MIARLWLAVLTTGAILFVLPAEITSQDKPIPRLANGKPDLSGFWDTVHVVDMTRDYDRCGTGQRGCTAQGVKDLESLYTPYAAEENKKQKFDYGGHCMPFGYVRSWGSIFPIQLVQNNDSLALLFEMFNWYHFVPTDGRDHPKDLEPPWMGHSVGKWDGDTLVIDTIGFNGKAWLDPSNNFLARMESDTMHTVERLSRPDFNHLNYELTVEDPKLYTKPFTSKRVFVPMKPGSEIQEYACIPRWELKNIN